MSTRPYRPPADDHPNRGPHTECLVDHGGSGVPRHCRRGCRWPCPDASQPHDGMAWEDLLAHPALTFDPDAEVTALLLAPSSDLPRRPWLYDANATTTASDQACPHERRYIDGIGTTCGVWDCPSKWPATSDQERAYCYHCGQLLIDPDESHSDHADRPAPSDQEADRG